MDTNKENMSGLSNVVQTQRAGAVPKRLPERDEGRASGMVPRASTRDREDTVDCEALVEQWRAKRQNRLMQRLMQRAGHKAFSSALLGIASGAGAPPPARDKTQTKGTRPNVKLVPSQPAVLPVTPKRPEQKVPAALQRTTMATSSKQDRNGAPRTGTIPKRTVLMPIRHTNASRLRLEKANPALGILKLAGMAPAATRATVRTAMVGTSDSTQIPKPAPSRTIATASTSQQSHSRDDTKRKLGMHQRVGSASNIGGKPSVEVQQRDVLRANLFQLPGAYSGLRRSISAPQFRQEELNTSLVCSNSEVQCATPCQWNTQVQDVHSPNTEEVCTLEHRTKNFNVKGCEQKAHGGMSEDSGSMPNAAAKQVSFLPTIIVLAPEPRMLRENLAEWLQENNLPIEAYQCLHNFSLTTNSTHVAPAAPDCVPSLNDTVTLSKEADIACAAADSIGTLPSPVGANIPTSTPEHMPRQLLPEILADLCRLISNGYPREQCEAWLTLIRNANTGVTAVPEYWECLAALEESRGAINEAIDCYGHAVVSGAKADRIEASLKQLWDRFNALEITPSAGAAKASHSRRVKNVLDAKQIFTSSIIKLALLQRDVKKMGAGVGEEVMRLNYIVTPVRRSTRRSTVRTGTPCYMHMAEIEPELRNAASFQENKALEPFTQ